MMIKDIAKKIVVVSLLSAVILGVMTPIGVFAVDCSDPANVSDPACGLSATSNSAVEAACVGVTAATGVGCENNNTHSTFETLMAKIMNIFSVVVGAVSVLMIIVGGFRYVISGGESSAVQGAKNTILYALVGLVVVLFSQIIVRFVFKTTTS